jgi:photosystem II stability/assembly factor-like uncharacterized protein
MHSICNIAAVHRDGEDMETTRETDWFYYPPITLPSPILALAAERQGIWAGGAGGVAWYPIYRNWEPRITGLHLSTVAALASSESGVLLAGGNGGIAYSSDGGLKWQIAEMTENTATVTALLLSPHYVQDQIALAATLDKGIMRSEDGGKHWQATTSGLHNFDTTSLVWAKSETALAGTIQGIYRSSDAGRTWKIAQGTEEDAVAALAYLSDGSLLAALESGGLLSSQNDGLDWAEYGSLPAEVQGTALWVTTTGTILLGTAEQGILRSTDKGLTWQCVHDQAAFSFIANGQTLYAGIMNELAASVDDGETWIALPHPPIHDLRQLLIDQDQPLLAGTYAGLLHYNPSRQAWVPLTETPRPLLAVALAPDGAYLISTQEGLERSTDKGLTWQNVLADTEGQITRITLRTDGGGWAGSANGKRLFKTADGGLHWEAVKPPFGALPLAALQAMPGQLIAATYDAQRYRAGFWRTLDDGQSWQQGIEVEMNWPIIATWHQPTLLTMGSFIHIQSERDQWRQEIVGNGQEPVRRVVGNGQILLALTTDSILRSPDSGVSWQKEENIPTAWQILDLTIHQNTLYLLLTGGQLCSRPL